CVVIYCACLFNTSHLIQLFMCSRQQVVVRPVGEQMFCAFCMHGLHTHTSHTHSHTLQLQYFSNSFVEISAYLPSPAKCDTFPDISHDLHRRKPSPMVSMRPVHTDMYLKVQTIRDGYRLVFIRYWYITDTFKTIPVPKRCRNGYFYKKKKKKLRLTTFKKGFIAKYMNCLK